MAGVRMRPVGGMIHRVSDCCWRRPMSMKLILSHFPVRFNKLVKLVLVLDPEQARSLHYSCKSLMS